MMLVCHPGFVLARTRRGGEIDLTLIEGLLDRLVETLRPRAIRLFGSRARGYAHSGSDWDLLVVVADETPGIDDPLFGWRVRKETGVRCDVILCEQSDFEDARDTPNTIAYEAAHAGVLIYER